MLPRVRFSSPPRRGSPCFMPASSTAPFRLDLNGFFEHMIGGFGLSDSEFAALLPRTDAVLADLAKRRGAGELPFYDLPRDHTGLQSIAEGARRIRDSYKTLLVLGIGGSALGTKAVLEALPTAAGEGVDVRVVDNLDPSTLGPLLESLDPASTAVNVISKSGATAETWAQFLIVRRWLSEVGRWQDRVVVTTDLESGPLRELARREDLPLFGVPDGVGGRFSVLSAVGLLPLAAAGIDIEALCAGAVDMDASVSGSAATRNPAALHAAALYLANTTAGAAMHVLMPYSDRLGRLSEWYAQLWAESIGKRFALDGEVVEAGQTPVRAVGATDQHSQIQLYVEGPRDKVVTFIRVEEHANELVIPRDEADVESVGYLGGHRLGALLNMEQRATELALVEASRPTSVITLARVDTESLGRLFHFFEVQTLVMGGLLGVNPLDQPGVEAGKRMTFAMAGRGGFDQDRERVEAMFQRKRAERIVG